MYLENKVNCREKIDYNRERLDRMIEKIKPGIDMFGAYVDAVRYWREISLQSKRRY